MFQRYFAKYQLILKSVLLAAILTRTGSAYAKLDWGVILREANQQATAELQKVFRAEALARAEVTMQHRGIKNIDHPIKLQIVYKNGKHVVALTTRIRLTKHYGESQDAIIAGLVHTILYKDLVGAEHFSFRNLRHLRNPYFTPPEAMPFYGRHAPLAEISSLVMEPDVKNSFDIRVFAYSLVIKWIQQKSEQTLHIVEVSAIKQEEINLFSQNGIPANYGDRIIISNSTGVHFYFNILYTQASLHRHASAKAVKELAITELLQKINLRSAEDPFFAKTLGIERIRALLASSCMSMFEPNNRIKFLEKIKPSAN